MNTFWRVVALINSAVIGSAAGLSIYSYIIITKDLTPRLNKLEQHLIK
jgi:hypothetical protein